MDEIFNIKRPKPSEGEDELFQMQEEFLKSKQQPSAKVINLRANQNQSQNPNGNSGKQYRSKFAERRAKEKLQAEQKKTINHQATSSSSSVTATEAASNNSDGGEKDVVRKLEDPIAVVPKNVAASITSGIIERKYQKKDEKFYSKFIDTPFDDDFPKVFVVDHSEAKNDGKSLFFQKFSQGKSHSDNSIDMNEIKASFKCTESSVLVAGELGTEVHKSNLEKLSKMTEEEILKEKRGLETSLDPNVIQFLKAKRNKSSNSTKNIIEEVSRMVIDEPKVDVNEIKMECDDEVAAEPPETVAELIQEASAKGWIHMDEVEPSKLEWMKEVPSTDDDGKAPDEPYNARFNFEGVLMPFKDSNISVDEGLHHHGEEPDRPGYSIQELLQLCRSSVQQQRHTALLTLANIIEKSRKGWYDKVLNPAPLEALSERNILILLRFSLDDSFDAVVTAALQALRAFLYDESDEICLDRLYGWKYFDGSYNVPELLPPKTDVEDMSTLKDHQLAQLDCVSAAIRSDILLRIKYILNNLKLPPIGITSALEILIRLARHSKITALNIASTPKLLEIIVNNFIPLNNNVKIPNIAALKLCRVLVEYAGFPVANRLHNLNIMNNILSYINNDNDMNDYLFKVSIESLRLWNILYNHGIAKDSIYSSQLMLNSKLQLMLTNCDLETASELFCDYASALVIVSSHETNLKIIISTLLTKWSTQLASITSITWSKMKLISTIISFNNSNDLSTFQTKWLNNPKIFENISTSSNLLLFNLPDSQRYPTSLPSLNVIIYQDEIQPIVNVKSCLPFLGTIIHKFCDNYNDNINIKTNLEIIVRNNEIVKYLNQLITVNWTLENNWFTRGELYFIYSIIRSLNKINSNDIEKNILLKISVKLISSLSADVKNIVSETLDIIFSNDELIIRKLLNDLNGLKVTTTNATYINDSSSINSSISESNLRALDILSTNISSIYKEYIESKVGNWNETSMPKDWLYLPIISMYNNSRNKIEWNENDLLKITVVLSLELFLSELFYNLTPTLRYSRIILIYLCDTIYLNNNISILLNKLVSKFIEKYYKKFDFNTVIPGLPSFNDLFTIICECFSSNSYGDDYFSMMLLIPIAQRHDVHYRKLLWSEHAGILRYIKLTTDKLVIPLEEYLTPIEQDLSLIESYLTALVRKTISKQLCPIIYVIALHHSAMFLRNSSSKLATSMKNRLTNINDKSLLDNLLNYTSPLDNI